MIKRQLPKDGFIRRAFISTSGDRSVGILPQEATVEARGGFIADLRVLADEDQPKAMDDFRAGLERTFEELWGEPVRVVFAHELMLDEEDA